MKKCLFALVFSFGVLFQLSSQAPIVVIKQFICNSDDTYHLVIEVYGAGDISTFGGYQVDAGIYEVSSCYDSSLDTGNPCYIVLPVPGPPPVCGCNGVQYKASSCAEIDGYSSWTEGPCTGNERVVFTIHNLPSAQNTTINVFRLVKIDEEEFLGPSISIQANHTCSQASCLTCHPKSNPLTFTVSQDTSITIEHLMIETTQGCSLSFDKTQNIKEIPFKCSFLKGQTSALDSFWVYDLVKGDSCLSFVRFVNDGYCCKPFTPCDDNNSCTYGDYYDNNCNCIGKIDTSNKEYSFTTTKGEKIVMDNIADSCNVYVFIFYFHWCKPCQDLYKSHLPSDYDIHPNLKVIPIMMEASEANIDSLKNYGFDFINNNPFLNIVEGGETEYLTDHCLNSAPTVFVKCPNKDTLLIVSGFGDKKTMPEVVNNIINDECKCASTNEVTISIPSKSVNYLDTFSIPVVVSGFQDIESFQFPITYDTTKLEYLNVHPLNSTFTNLFVGGHGLLNKGQIICNYFRWFGQPISLPGQDTLFKILFRALSPTCDSTVIKIANSILVDNQPFNVKVVQKINNQSIDSFTDLIDAKIKINQVLCNDCTHPDYAPLMALYNATNGSGWTNNTGWKEGAQGTSCDPCNFNGIPWYGISCENGRVTCIAMNGRGCTLSPGYPGNNLKGILPSSLNSISELKYLFLGNNQLTGTIPNFNLTNLLYIDLDQNQLNGEIPNLSLPNLRDLRLYSNELSGEIPEFNLPKLEILYLYRNNLTGSIPKFKLANLKLLNLEGNQLSGAIPELLPNMPKIANINLDDNQLSGCYPEWVCGFQNFRSFGNVKLPWAGDITNFCNGESQTGAPCDDNNPDTSNDKIQEDCSCRGCISSTFMQSFSICSFESVIVGNSTYTLGGTYIDTLQSYLGCDSILTTVIIQKPNATHNQNIQLCQGESIIVGTNTYNKDGFYVDTLVAKNGCDSFVNTFLTIFPVSFAENAISICHGSSITVGNKVYNQSGNYLDTLQSINGCDSTIQTKLTIRPEISFTINGPDKICKGDEAIISTTMQGTYLWSNGQTTSSIMETLETNTTYTLTLTDNFGCFGTTAKSVMVVAPKIKGIPIKDTIAFCLKDTLIDPFSLLTQYDSNGTWLWNGSEISGQPFNLNNISLAVHSLVYGFYDQLPCPDSYTSLVINVKDCRIEDCSFGVTDDSIRVNKNQVAEILLTANDILPDTFIVSIISTDPDVLDVVSLNDAGLFMFTPSAKFSDGAIVTYEVCTPDCTECKQAKLYVTNEVLKDIIITNIILPNSSGNNATLRFTKDEVLEDSELYIFNRNGDKIFHKVDYDNTWNADGYPGGIYFYVLRYRGVDIKKTLTVMK
ncbi:MAG TPA: gliding motility-associated C-terminal domain-containing protein [Saprospiraceae bacterium]|jgi:hypothetical protein|nr:gliding motility-associated C-terminal domain-containing protein [Saprospiraceae bacterium]